MKTIKSFLKAYFVAFGLIALPFIILAITSLWIQVNLEIIVYGLTFSMLSSVLIAYNFRYYEKSVKYDKEDLFVKNIINSLDKIGYFVNDKTTGTIEFKPTVHTSIFAGKISICLANNTAIIKGSRLPVRKGLALALNCNKSRLFKRLLLGEYLKPPLSEDYLINSMEFEQAEEIVPVFSIKKSEED